MVTAATTRTPQRRFIEPDVRIRRQTDRNLSYYAEHPDFIDERLAELDREWPAERVFATQLGTAGLVGLALGLFHRRFLVLPAVALGFLLQQATHGRSATLELWRRLGLRFAREIDSERQALLALRADRRRMHAGEEPRGESTDPSPPHKIKGRRQPRPSAEGDGRGGRRAHESP
jgi:hypothetical protein